MKAANSQLSMLIYGNLCADKTVNIIFTHSCVVYFAILCFYHFAIEFRRERKILGIEWLLHRRKHSEVTNAIIHVIQLVVELELTIKIPFSLLFFK